MARAAVVRRDDPGPGDSEESLKDALSQTLDEARMVLPGVQALFGFQLIAAFSDGFAQRLSDVEQDLHLVAIVLVTVAIALMMMPAAYHRQVDRQRATGEFLAMASRLVTGSTAFATALGGAVFAMFVLLWFIFPQWRAARRRAPKR